MINRRSLIASGACLAFAGPVRAHHGWRWTAGGLVRVLVPMAVTGLVLAVLAGNGTVNAL